MTPPYLTARVVRRGAARLAVGLAALAVPAAALAGSGGGGLGGVPVAAPAPPGPGLVLIAGAGAGPGVGMSQYGAEGYALHGAGDRAILAHYFTGTALGRTDPGRPVRVLLADAPGAASFTGARSIGGLTASPRVRYAVTALGDALSVTDVATGARVGRPAASMAVAGAGGEVRTGGRLYRGTLWFTPDGTGGVRTVDVVGLDDYVRGVVAEEMPSGWAPAALQAQAIATRTYAITTTVDGDGFGLYDDTRSQVYGGVAAETPATDAAVAATAGQVVTFHGAPVVTYFFQSSGGYTESIQDAWPGSAPEPWLVGVPDPYDGAAGDPEHSWRVRMTVAAATARLGSLVRGTLRRVVVTRTGVSPRVMTATVIGSRGTTTVTGAQLQGALGLPSTWMRFAIG